jgi:hypothetical protein
MELTALEHRGSAQKGKEEFALLCLGKHLLAAAHLGPYGLPCCQEKFDLLSVFLAAIHKIPSIDLHVDVAHCRVI